MVMFHSYVSLAKGTHDLTFLLYSGPWSVEAGSIPRELVSEATTFHRTLGIASEARTSQGLNNSSGMFRMEICPGKDAEDLNSLEKVLRVGQY